MIMDTSMGTITARLFEKEVPESGMTTDVTNYGRAESCSLTENSHYFERISSFPLCRMTSSAMSVDVTTAKVPGSGVTNA